MTLVELLHRERAPILADALVRLERAQLPHYTQSNRNENQERLAALYDLTVECVTMRKLGPMTAHATDIARTRFEGGFRLDEVHTAFNVLEELIWHAITARLEPTQYPEALGLVSTVLGAGKQALAQEYVALAGNRRSQSTLDVSALFQGTA